MTLDDITDENEWLEDSDTGRYVRYSVGTEDSKWFCTECGAESEECSCEDAWLERSKFAHEATL